MASEISLADYVMLCNVYENLGKSFALSELLTPKISFMSCDKE